MKPLNKDMRYLVGTNVSVFFRSYIPRALMWNKLV